MKTTAKLTLFGVTAALALTVLTPFTARADDAARQKNKNLWRNGAILGGAAALYGLGKHDTTTTVLGAAGAAYAAKRYEEDRHSQDQTQRARASYHRTYSGAGRKYYWFNGHQYYKNLNDGSRHLVN